MIDIDKAIRTAAKTGKVSFGMKTAIRNVRTGKAKMIVLARNCPEKKHEKMEYYSKLSNVPLVVYEGTAIDLASAVGKPFIVSALTIREPGDSEILRLGETIESERL